MWKGDRISAMIQGMAKYRTLSNDYKLSARSLRVVWDAMVNAVRGFADEDVIRFRERKLGNEAFVNAAVWHLAELPREQQEAILRRYLPRLEGYLVVSESQTVPSPAEADDPPPLSIRPPARPELLPSRDVRTGKPAEPPNGARRKRSS